MKKPKLSPDLTDRICKMIRVGVPSEAAARASGVILEQFAEWMARGLGEHPEKKTTPRYRAFARAIEQAEAEAVAFHAATLTKAARDGAWRASAWWLSRRGGQRWASTSTVTIQSSEEERQLLAQIRALRAKPYTDPRLRELPEGEPDSAEPLALDDGVYIDPSRKPNVVIVNIEPVPSAPAEPAV